MDTIQIHYHEAITYKAALKACSTLSNNLLVYEQRVYQQLPGYLDRLRAHNPHVYTHLQTINISATGQVNQPVSNEVKLSCIIMLIIRFIRLQLSLINPIILSNEFSFPQPKLDSPFNPVGNLLLSMGHFAKHGIFKLYYLQ